MAQHSLYATTFRIGNAGPYNTAIGISGGKSGDVQTHTLAATIAAAITSNLLSIMQSMDASITGVPAGTVVIEKFAHAAVPNFWE